MVFTDLQNLVSFVISKKLPDWQTKLFRKYRDEVQVHSQGELFYKVDTLFPNEAIESKRQRILSFEPITKSSFNKGLNGIMRIFNNSSYTAQASEETIKLITAHTFENKNLFSYFLELWITTALGYDPNALIVVYPPDFMKGKTFQQVLAVSSEHVVYMDSETVCFKSEEESEVSYDTYHFNVVTEEFFDYSIDKYNLREWNENTYTTKLKATFKKTVWHCFSQNKFYRIEQPQATGQEYQITEFDCGANKKPPVVFAGGTKAQRKVYESFLAPFVYFGNLALLQHTQHTAVNFTFSFPRMSEIQSPCTYSMCNNGYITCAITDEFPEGKKPCPKCSGGYTTNQTPYKVYIRKLDTSGLSGDNDHLKYDDVKYYTPDVDILDYSKDEWKSYLEEAERAIYVKQKVVTGNVESADSKKIDLDDYFAFLMRVAEMFYDRLRATIQFEENYTVANPIDVNVSKPFSFAILTEGEAFEALNFILTSNAPAIIKGTRVDAFIEKFVSQSSPVKKAYDVLKLVDLLLLKNDNEIALLKSNGIVPASDWVIHTYSYPVLMQMYERDKTLFEQDADIIADQLEKELEQYEVQESDLKTKLQAQFSQPAPAA